MVTTVDFNHAQGGLTHLEIEHEIASRSVSHKLQLSLREACAGHRCQLHQPDLTVEHDPSAGFLSQCLTKYLRHNLLGLE